MIVTTIKIYWFSIKSHVVFVKSKKALVNYIKMEVRFCNSFVSLNYKKMKKIITTAFTIFTFASLYGQSYPTNGLVGFWAFDGNFFSNTNISMVPADIENSEFGPDRKNKQSGAFACSQRNRLTLDGSSEELQPNNISVSLWFKPNLLNLGLYPILAKQGNQANTFNAFAIGLVNSEDNNSSEIYCQIGINDTMIKVGKNMNLKSIDEVWTHVVMTYNGIDINLYMNDTLIGTKAATGAIDFSKANTAQIYGSDYTGWFDDLAIYNRGLNKAEVTHLFTGTAPSTNVKNIKANNNLSIYPNPAQHILQIVGLKDLQTALIVNNLGQTTEVNVINNSIAIGNLASGVYSIQTKDEKGNLYTNKFIKE